MVYSLFRCSKKQELNTEYLNTFVGSLRGKYVQNIVKNLLIKSTLF